MLITYFDEAKYQKGEQPYEWLGGIAVPDRLIPELEYQVGELAQECFGDSTLSKATEFHATAIFARKDNFKDWPNPAKRLEVLKQLIKIVDRHDEIFKVYARLDPSKMLAADGYGERAFVFFVERVDLLLEGKKEIGILIGDHEHDRIATANAQSLSKFRKHGTPYEFGREIRGLIDTVHFTHSHLSRMLQLADVYVWCLQLCHRADRAAGVRDELVKFIREETKLLQPHRYKEWPTDDSWALNGS